MSGVKRSPRNPILTRADIPTVDPHVSDVSSVFNPGAFRRDGRHHLILRVQTRGRETVLMPASAGPDGRFRVEPRLLRIHGLRELGLRLFHVYDLRVSPLEGELFGVFAADAETGCHLGVARLAGDRLDLVGFDGDRRSRNGVLFPERIGGRYLRLERSNDVTLPSGVASGDRIWLAESDDLARWRPVGPVLEGRPRYWDELIGSGPPPVKTRDGWLHIYHGVATHFAASSVYQAGVCLLDLEDPSRVLARGRDNILEPRELYELTGQVPNVVFPTGIVVAEQDDEGFARRDSAVHVYYGAADTCVCVAETTIAWLLGQCRIG